MDLLKPADWTFPIPIAYGPGRIKELGLFCRQAGSQRPLIVTDRGSRELPFINQAQKALLEFGIESAVFSEVAPNPSDRDIVTGCTFFRSGQHDAVIAIGGGSGMDAGKSISLLALNNTELKALDYDQEPPANLGARDFAPLICVPTTAGTGAETESTAMVTDLERMIKICIWHPAQKPYAAILDPELTLALPKTLTAWTGIDALVHAIEAYAVADWHPMCDALALEAIRLIYRYLATAVHDGSNLEARGAMLVGSCLAGVSFMKGLGLVHAMSHMIGAVYDTHHGLTNAVLLPIVLKYNQDVLAEKTALMSQAMGLANNDFASFYKTIVDLLDKLEIPTDLASLGITEDRLHELAEKAFADAASTTNPAAATVEDIERLLRQALHKAR